MNWRKIGKVLDFVDRPWRENALFFVAMYVLGCTVAWLTVPHYRGAHLYEHLYTELFADVSVLCIVLSLIPKKVRRWVKAAFAAVAYAVALVDVYCFVTYDTTLTPTVMMLLAETNSREAGEFLQTLLSPDLIKGPIGYILLIIIVHGAIATAMPYLNPSPALPTGGGGINDTLVGVKTPSHVGEDSRKREQSQVYLHFAECSRGSAKPIGRGGVAFGGLFLLAFIYCSLVSFDNKPRLYRLMTAGSIGTIENILTEKHPGELYQPLYRLAFSAYANSLTAQQIKKLQRAADAVAVDSCSFRSPHIILIIGESYSRHHSHQYGYWQPTTPRQEALAQTGRLITFSDVITPWNLTSFVSKLMFSTYSVGDEGEWCDYPLFPELFKAAGYHVTFLTNQFLPKAREAVYDFSGGFFLNDPKLSEAQFDTRNSKLHRFDEELLTYPIADAPATLSIYHLAGQHVMYRQRSPEDRKRFQRDEYNEAKPHLNARERQTLADYDNAILYNDSVVTEIARRFDDRDAIVLYVPDHGEECYEGTLHFFCRMHSAKITSRLAHAEFDIPFWIYCTPEYQKNHPEIFEQILAARDKPYMIDRLPHLLLYLAGIQCKEYREEQNPLSPSYDEKRPRILKNTTDYDTLDKD